VQVQLTKEQETQLKGMSAEERKALLDVLLAPQEEAPRKKRPLDTKEAIQVQFVADLERGKRVKDDTYVGTTLWFTGMDNVKGPETGVYCYGRCVVGVKSEARKGILKISSRTFNEFKSGGKAEAWVRFDGDTTDTLVGMLSGYRSPKQNAAAKKS
jgi:hypothetical protein